MAKARVIIVEEIGLSMLVMVHWPECSRLVIMASMSSMDAVAWVRKYLVEASMARGLYRFISMGMTASMFISNPIQMRSQWELIITIRVPRIMVEEIMEKMRGFISTGGV